ncbi:hypothetical protein EN45_058320 [Penicillium chrysogenum]|uniref:Pc20g03390 protein n=2 Tax=Penicillium chrysogenum species complex TaxID=254878 RepID=B6HG26_PENRW|nr:uncharacterized protein N7525_008781 [Penicillium rubens]KAJ5830528.1 hypothetical protein N7525_008781 [Penicillium rubens]KZN87274.1 hypothetical protein EN45_058320 [Penicillium chrysogenum]CAP85668.1 Pc20g03390 [Penicillium rubens Wisconsin 54-1255]
MAGPPHHVPLSASGTPGQDESTRDLYLPYGYAAHQYPPSLAAEPSTFSENHLLYNTLMQHSSAPVHLSYSMPFSSAHGTFNPASHNMAHHPSSENNTPSDPSTMGYISSGYSTACTTPLGSGRSSPSMQEIPQSSVSRPEVPTICGRGRAHRPKHDELYGMYQCNWKDCKYRGMFSRKGVLMRHIETQHVAPHSFDCPVCGKLFCRRDNMTEHLGKVQCQRV